MTVERGHLADIPRATRRVESPLVPTRGLFSGEVPHLPMLGSGERGRRRPRRRGGAPQPVSPDAGHARLPQPNQPDGRKAPVEKKPNLFKRAKGYGVRIFQKFIEGSYQKVGTRAPRAGETPYPEYLLSKNGRQSPLRPERGKKPFFQRFWEKAGINYEESISKMFGNPVEISQGILNNPLTPANTTRLQWEFILASQVTTKIPHSKHYALMHWSREVAFWVAEKLTSAALFIPFTETLVDLYASHLDRKRGLVNESSFQNHLAFFNFLSSLTVFIPGFGIPINFALDTLAQDRYFDPQIQAHNADVREFDMNAMNDAMLNSASPFHPRRGQYAQVVAGLANFGAGRKAIEQVFENRRKISKVVDALSAEDVAITTELAALRAQPQSRTWLFGERINRARQAKITQLDNHLQEVRTIKAHELGNQQYVHRLFQMVDYSVKYYMKQGAIFEAQGNNDEAKRNRSIAKNIQKYMRNTRWTKLKDIPIITA